jgi:hypothetical protein
LIFEKNTAKYNRLLNLNKRVCDEIHTGKMKAVKKALIFTSLIFICSAVGAAHGQNRKSVSATEVNGTFRSYFSGKFKDSYNEVKILALGKRKLRVAFTLVYPYIEAAGEMSANTGEAEGTATIAGDTSIYSSDEFGQCRITIKFVKPGTIEITQNGTDAECGFGRNVNAGGTYKKSSSVKPKF